MNIKRYLKTLSSFSLILCIILTSSFSSIAAAPWGGTVGELPILSDGVYKISTPEQLAAFAKSVNDGNPYSKKKIVLMNDIDLNNKEWTPIGNEESRIFSGEFDGQEFYIKGLKVDKFATGDIYSRALFGRVVNAIVKNLKVSGNIVVNMQYCSSAGIIAESFNSIIYNCSFHGKIYGEYNSGGDGSDLGGNVGGICAVAHDCRIEKCANNAEISALDAYVGGIVANAYNSMIKNCTNNQKLKVGGSYRTAYFLPLGGICGYLSGGVVSDSINNFNILCEGVSYVGGIVGATSEGDFGKMGVIESCKNYGNISGYNCVGGIAGSIKYRNQVRKCINKKIIKATYLLDPDREHSPFGNNEFCGTLYGFCEENGDKIVW